jgi:hypothetical protein
MEHITWGLTGARAQVLGEILAEDRLLFYLVQNSRQSGYLQV